MKDISVQSSEGRAFCIPNSSEYHDWAFLWAGPFESERAAEQVCRAFRRLAVSEDCYVPEGN